MARRHLQRLLLFLSFALLNVAAQAQEVTEVKQEVKKVKKEHSAKKAAYMSILPGLGQVYNGKWWKVPIIYAGFGGIGYMAYSNYTDYQLFLTAYKIKTGNLDEGATPSDEAQQLAAYYQAGQLQSYKDVFRRDFEFYCILAAAWYGLNIVDAIVDGHLYSYDISDDLSFTVDPVFSIQEAPHLAFGGRQTGLSFSFNF